MHKTFQKSFVQCREAIHNTFMESLVSLTELTVEENNSGRTNWDRREELESVQRAYQCLLQHCSPKLDAVDRSLIAKNVSKINNSLSSERNLGYGFITI